MIGKSHAGTAHSGPYRAEAGPVGIRSSSRLVGRMFGPLSGQPGCNTSFLRLSVTSSAARGRHGDTQRALLPGPALPITWTPKLVSWAGAAAIQSAVVAGASTSANQALQAPAPGLPAHLPAQRPGSQLHSGQALPEPPAQQLLTASACR